MTSEGPQFHPDTDGKADVARILVPLSGGDKDERAIPVARRLAEVWELPIALMSAVSDDVLVDRLERYLEGIEDQLPDLATSISVVVCGAHPLAAIAAECGPETVPVMATSGRLLIHDTYMGSAGAWVVRETQQPVVLVGPRCDPASAFDIDRVVVPTDGSPLGDRAVALGAEWARRFDLPLRLVTVLGEAELVPPDEPQPESPPVEIEHLEALGAEACRANPDIRIDWEVRYADDVARAVAAYAGRGGLICLGSHGRTGLASIAMGSVARKIIRQATQPVIVRRSPELGAAS